MRQRTRDNYQNSSREKICVAGNSYFINALDALWDSTKVHSKWLPSEEGGYEKPRVWGLLSGKYKFGSQVRK